MRTLTISGPYSGFAHALQDAIRASGTTYAGIARASGVPVNSIQTYGVGIAVPGSVDRLQAIIAHLTCSDALQQAVWTQWHALSSGKASHQRTPAGSRTPEAAERLAIAEGWTRLRKHEQAIADKSAAAQERVRAAWSEYYDRARALERDRRALEYDRALVKRERDELDARTAAFQAEVSAWEASAPDEPPAQLTMLDPAPRSLDLELARLHDTLTGLRANGDENAALIAGILNAVARITEQARQGVRACRAAA